MQLEGEGKLLRIFVGERDRHERCLSTNSCCGKRGAQ